MDKNAVCFIAKCVSTVVVAIVIKYSEEKSITKGDS